MTFIEKTKELEIILAESVGRRHGVLFGSGTASLMAALSALPNERRFVVVPATVCIQVVYAVLYAGSIPVFADVRLSDSTIDPGQVKELVANDPRIGAIVAVHLYGHPADMDSLEKIANDHSLLLIEDAAQAQGGVYRDGSSFGSRGDISIISFGYSKILDAGGGGILLTNEDSVADSARIIASKLPEENPQKEMISNEYSKSFYEAWNAYKNDKKNASMFYPFAGNYKDLFVSRVNEKQVSKIQQLADKLETEVDRRRQVYASYLDIFSKISGLGMFDVDHASASPWRFCFRVPGRVRDRVVESIRAIGFNASTWYPDVSDWVPRSYEGGNSLEVSRVLQDEIVNLWLTGDVDSVNIGKVANCVRTMVGKEHVL